MKSFRKISTLLAAAALLLSAGTAAMANSADLDAGKTGSVSVTVHDTKTGTVVTGGKLTIYKVADLVPENGEYAYAYTDEFRDSVYSLDNLDSAALHEGLAAYAEHNSIPGTEKPLDQNGKAVFPDLSVGLYLIRQTGKTDQGTIINAFLVSIPASENGHLNYDVDASPKVGTTPPPTTPPTQDTSRPPLPPGYIPQTGQLWWPVPVLAIGGLLCLLIGMKKEKSREKE